MSDTDIPSESIPEDSLAHYGVPGMQWGKRKSDGGEGSSEGSGFKLTEGQKKGLKVAGGALAVGALITGAVLVKNGTIPVGSLRPPSIPTAAMRDKADQAARQKLLNSMSTVKSAASKVKTAAETVAEGKQIIDELRGNEAFQKKVSDFQNQINEAHREQNRYMIDNSANSGIPYNSARDNAYSPEARRR